MVVLKVTKIFMTIVLKLRQKNNQYEKFVFHIGYF